jgi:hypothetical protein
VGYQPTELRTTESITNQMMVIDKDPGDLSNQAINWIRATEDVQFAIGDDNLSERIVQGVNFGKICDPNDRLAAIFKDLEATEPVRDGPARSIASPRHNNEKWQDKLQIKKCRSTKFERRLDKCKSEPQKTQQTDIAQLRLDKDMLLHEVKNKTQKRHLESALRGFEQVIQQLKTKQVHATPAQNTS